MPPPHDESRASRLYGHGGICDRMRQALTAAGAYSSILRKSNEPEIAESLHQQLNRLDMIVAELENRGGELNLPEHVRSVLAWRGVNLDEVSPELWEHLRALDTGSG